MLKRLLILATVSVMLSGCVFVAPIALVGPATSGFTTASIVQTAITQTGSYMIKKSTGKSLSEHAYDTLKGDVLKQGYVPTKKNKKIDLD
tara:strand:+ start:230 stop:499 length:270 start_codon:yes stop_codon:yes gene_type:complete